MASDETAKVREMLAVARAWLAWKEGQDAS